jgi:hypothetical protein
MIQRHEAHRLILEVLRIHLVSLDGRQDLTECYRRPPSCLASRQRSTPICDARLIHVKLFHAA